MIGSGAQKPPAQVASEVGRTIALVEELLAGTVAGTLVYGRLAVVLWRAAVRRFEREWEVRE